MKIAIVTVDQKTVSQHFGRSPFYVIYEIENEKIIGKEIRERRTGHFAKNQEHNHQHEHNEQGRGFGAESDKKHDAMAQEIADCQVLIAGGMGRGAYQRFFNNGINVIMTDKQDIDETVNAYIQGDLPNKYNERTH